MSALKTPVKNVRSSDSTDSLEQLGTPIFIPPSPYMQKLGYGTGVTVYRLDRNDQHSKSPWAIKKLTTRCKEENAVYSNIYRSRMLQEATVLRTLHHPNIIGFRSIVTDINTGDSSLALECCSISLGDLLEQRLDEYGVIPLPASQIKAVQRDIAMALNYLHSEVYILHGDIKSHNILVKGNFEICKLCDFGVCLPLEKDTGEVNLKKNPHLKYVGTTLWTAPEIIRESEVISSRADIFSFGLVIYEMIALVPPHTVEILESEDDYEDNDDSIDVDEDDNVTKIPNNSFKIENRNKEELELQKDIIITNQSDNYKREEENIHPLLEIVNIKLDNMKLENDDKGEDYNDGSKSDLTTIEKKEHLVDNNEVSDHVSNESPRRYSEIESTSKELLISYNDEEEEDPFISKYGTRPSIPGVMKLGPEYNLILEIFYLCTNAEPMDRPTAKQILDSL